MDFEKLIDSAGGEASVSEPEQAILSQPHGTNRAASQTPDQQHDKGLEGCNLLRQGRKTKARLERLLNWSAKSWRPGPAGAADHPRRWRKPLRMDWPRAMSAQPRLNLRPKRLFFTPHIPHCSTNSPWAKIMHLVHLLSWQVDATAGTRCAGQKKGL